jgi:hypothetical protein
MQNIPINLWSVLVAAIVNFALGGLWYSPVLFAGPWARLAGVSEAQLKQRLPQGMAVDAVSSLAMAYMLALAIRSAGSAGLLPGAVTGLITALAFIALPLLSAAIYEGRPPRLFLINACYRLLAVTAMGAILGSWG